MHSGSRPSIWKQLNAITGQFNSAWDDGSDASGLTWAQHIHQGLTAANVSAYLYWWGSTSGNGDNESLVVAGS